MSFSLSKNMNHNKTFLVSKLECFERWDPRYHNPKYSQLVKNLEDCPWKRERVANLVPTLFGGATPEKSNNSFYAESGIRFFRVLNIADNEFNLSDLNFIAEETHNQYLKRSQLKENDVLMTITGRVGNAAVITKDLLPANINQHIVALRLNASDVLPEYLSVYLNSLIGIALTNRGVTGGTRIALDYGTIRSIQIPIPPRPMQERIIQSAQVAYTAKRKKEQQAKNLLATVDDILLCELGIKLELAPFNSIKSRIYSTSFRKVTGQRLDPLYYYGDMFYFVRGANCNLVSLGVLVSYFLTGFAAGRDDQGDKIDGVIQIRPTNINDDRELVFHRNIYIAATELKSRRADLLKPGEALFNNTNSQEQVGKTAHFELSENYFSSNHITRIGTKRDKLSPLFLCYLLNLYQRRRIFYKLCTNWNNQSGVGVDILKRMPIPLPDIKQQEQIVRRLEKIRSEAKELRRKAIEELDEAKKSIETLILGKGEKA